MGIWRTGCTVPIAGDGMIWYHISKDLKNMKHRKPYTAIIAGASFVFACHGAPCDPVAFGFSPDASPSVNAAALQKALDGGHKTVRVDAPGTYLMDRTVFIDSDTRLEFAAGVVLKKAVKYANVLVNRGAFEYKANTNIVVKGLVVSVNGNEAVPPPDSAAPGLRGQLAFYRVNRVRVEDFRCEDLGRFQYCIHFVDFSDIVVDNFTIIGGKDGVHLNCGRNFVVRNGYCRTDDDTVAVNAGEWPGGCAPKIGSIENGVVEKLHVIPGGKASFARTIAGSWKDWHPGMRLQRNDIVRSRRNVYAIYPMPLSTNEIVSMTGPSHTNGVWRSPEGINFQFLQSDGATRADVRNVTFRDIYSQGPNGILCAWEVNTPWARLVHPEIEPKDYPEIDISLENVTIDNGRYVSLVSGSAPATIRMRDVRSSGSLINMRTLHGYKDVKRTILISSSIFDGPSRDDFIFLNPDAKIDLRLESNIERRPAAVKAANPANVHVSR